MRASAAISFNRHAIQLRHSFHKRFVSDRCRVMPLLKVRRERIARAGRRTVQPPHRLPSLAAPRTNWSKAIAIAPLSSREPGSFSSVAWWAR